MTQEQIDAILQKRYRRAYAIISEFGGQAELMIAVAHDIERLEEENRKRSSVKGEVGGFYDKETQQQIDLEKTKAKEEEEAWDKIAPSMELPKEKKDDSQ